MELLIKKTSISLTKELMPSAFHFALNLVLEKKQETPTTRLPHSSPANIYPIQSSQ